MESNIESYLAEKSINYKKHVNVKNNKINYVFSKCVIFEKSFSFMGTRGNHNTFYGYDTRFNNFIDDLNKNNYNYMQVLSFCDNYVYNNIYLHMCDSIYVALDHDINYVHSLCEFIKFINYQTIFKIVGINVLDDLSDFNNHRQFDYIEVGDYKIRHVLEIEIYRQDVSENKYNSSPAKFIEWFTTNFPEYLRNNDIKIALKN